MKAKIYILNILILLLFFLVAASLFLFYRGNPQAQFIIVIFAALAYVGWGIWHHYLEERLNFKVISEYILLAVLVILLFYFRWLF